LALIFCQAHRIAFSISIQLSSIINFTHIANVSIMAGGTPHGEPSVGSDTPRQKGKATPETLKMGCIAWVEKDGQPRRAEILSIKETKSGKHFYCNFDNFNKRLDEWVPVARIDFSQDVEWPNPEKDKPKDSKTKKAPSAQPKKSQVSKKAQKRPGKREQSVNSEATTPHPWTGKSDHHILRDGRFRRPVMNGVD
jgi:histone acetyltransferase HTATIP